MDYFFISIFFILLINVFKFFSKKLIVLLIFESMMLCLIFLYSFFFSPSFLPFMIMLIFSLFMVLDSIFGICVFISTSKSTSMVSSNFNSI